MANNLKTKRKTIRIGGKLKEMITVHDEKGKVLHKMLSPLMVEFYIRDLIQVMVGATILAIPVAFTEETWNLGQKLPTSNVMFILGLSILFLFIFAYHNYYRNSNINQYIDELFKRVFGTYIGSFLVVTVLLIIIQKAPWTTDWLLALKRTIIITFPASMSAAVADMIK
jgi:uncharacterized membrane protein